MSRLKIFSKKINLYKVRKYGFLSFMFVVTTFVLYRLYVLKPQFFIKVSKIALVATVIIIVSRFLFKTLSKKCPLCGSAMSEQTPIRLFNGAVYKKKILPPIGKRVIACPNCENELHFLFYYEDDTSYVKQDLEGYLKNRVVVKNELPSISLNSSSNEITEDQYNSLTQSFIDKVNNHNRKAGFKKQIKQIKKMGR